MNKTAYLYRQSLKYANKILDKNFKYFFIRTFKLKYRDPQYTIEEKYEDLKILKQYSEIENIMTQNNTKF